MAGAVHKSPRLAGKFRDRARAGLAMNWSPSGAEEMIPVRCLRFQVRLLALSAPKPCRNHVPKQTFDETVTPE